MTEDAMRLAEIKEALAEQRHKMKFTGREWDYNISDSSVEYLISQAERLTKVEDSLRVAEEALEKISEKLPDPKMDSFWTQELAEKCKLFVREALKKIRGEK